MQYDIIGLMILVTGVVRIVIALYLGWIAVRTWRNPHPQGRRVMPEFVAVLSAIFANDGLRAVNYYISTEPTESFMAYEGMIGMGFSLGLTLMLCLMVLKRTQKVEEAFTRVLK
jgi:Na+/H+ antiporter NhaD/arsenite permease-like protein